MLNNLSEIRDALKDHLVIKDYHHLCVIIFISSYGNSCC